MTCGVIEGISSAELAASLRQSCWILMWKWGCWAMSAANLLLTPQPTYYLFVAYPQNRGSTPQRTYYLGSIRLTLQRLKKLYLSKRYVL